MPPRTIQSDASFGKAAIRALEGAVKALSETTATLHDAIFGRWDKDNNSEVPGLNDRMRRLEERQDYLIKALKTIGYLALPVVVVVFLRALGAPTEDIGHAAANVFWSYLPH